MINYLALASAIFISGIAAYYSIAGLVAMFSAAVIPIIIMGAALESGKLIAASIAYRNWSNKEFPAVIKYYLAIAVVILMFITSMGIFGFLSKAHMDQGIGTSSNTIIIKNLERELQSEESNIRNNQTSLDTLDRLVSSADPKDGVTIRVRQKREREAINNNIRESNNKITSLNTELTPLRKENAAFEAEVGPIKYVADLIYGEASDQYLDKAIRWVIIIIVMVFDPLAVILLIAANYGMNQQVKKPPVVRRYTKKKDSWVAQTKDFLKKRNSDTVSVNKKSIMKLD
jgi:hypothetical protein